MSYLELWSVCFAISLAKLKSLYLLYHNIYGHKTRQDGDLPWQLFTPKVKLQYNNVVLWNQVTKWKNYISTTTMRMATKFDRMMNYLDLLLPIKSHDRITTWSCKIHNVYGYQFCQGGDIQWGIPYQ